MTDKNPTPNRSRRVWLAIGAIVLIVVLLLWLWTIGTFEDITGVTNG